MDNMIADKYFNDMELERINAQQIVKIKRFIRKHYPYIPEDVLVTPKIKDEPEYIDFNMKLPQEYYDRQPVNQALALGIQIMKDWLLYYNKRV
jgi:hypothetical protein